MSHSLEWCGKELHNLFLGMEDTVTISLMFIKDVFIFQKYFIGIENGNKGGNFTALLI